MSIKYAVIARDPAMTLCEHLQDDSLPSKAKDAFKRYLTEAVSLERNATTMENFSEYIVCTLNDTILFGCI